MSDLHSVSLARDRLADALCLSAEAGWNQVEDDWQFMLAAGQSFGFANADGKLVASGLTLEFSGFGWIRYHPRHHEPGARLGDAIGARLHRHANGAQPGASPGRERRRSGGL